MGGARERRWLRPLWLFVVAIALAIGQPLLLVATVFAILTFLAPGGGLMVLALAVAAMALVFSGEPAGGLWYVERGWAILVAGCFGAATLAWPERSFFLRALIAVGGGVAAAGVVLWTIGGWPALDALVEGRLQIGAAATLDTLQPLVGGDLEGGISAAIASTVRLQQTLFPALAGLSSLAAAGVGWWLHARLTRGSDQGLGGIRECRFPDPLVWVMVVGVLLVLVAGGGIGWGRVGGNLVVFMAGLYTLRGAGVILFLWGGASMASSTLLLVAFVVGMVLAGPLLLAGAMLVGLGDSWLDIRARLRHDDGRGMT